MKQLLVIAALALSGCATTAASLAETRVEKTISSGKTAAKFALCAAENLTSSEYRTDGERHWVLVQVYGVPRHRWDFVPTSDGSIAELRSTGLAGAGAGAVERCS